MPRWVKYAIGVVVLIIVLIIIIPQFFYIVDETDQALVLRFGEFNRQKTEPGLNWKIPFVETVTKYDKRLLRFDAPPETLITLDKKNLIIDAYARYKIVDPKVFFETVLDEAGADSRLRDIIGGELKKQIASFNQSDIIKDQRRFGFIDGVPTIVQATRDEARIKARDIGVEIIDVRIKRADFTDPIQQSIFQRMNAERQRAAALFRAEGSEQDFRIRATANRFRTITIANAERDAEIIKGCGDAVAVKIFAAAFNQDPEFFTFQRSLEAYAELLGNQDTLVLDANSELFRYLNDPSGVLNGQLPAGFPSVLGEAPPAASGPIEAPDRVGDIFDSDTIDQLVLDCEAQSGFVQFLDGIVENVDVVSVFEAGLTTTDINWTVGGQKFLLRQGETQIRGEPALEGVFLRDIEIDDVKDRQVSVTSRREPAEDEFGNEILLAIRITFQ